MITSRRSLSRLHLHCTRQIRPPTSKARSHRDAHVGAGRNPESHRRELDLDLGDESLTIAVHTNTCSQTVRTRSAAGHELRHVELVVAAGARAASARRCAAASWQAGVLVHAI